MGNFRYSEFVFRNLIKSNPGYSLAYDGLAVTLSKAGRAKEAIAFHEKAIALDPREPSYYFNCAISYLMMGNTATARPCHRRPARQRDREASDVSLLSRFITRRKLKRLRLRSAQVADDEVRWRRSG